MTGPRFDRALRTVKEYLETVEYIPLDPVRRGLVQRRRNGKGRESVSRQGWMQANQRADAACLPQAGLEIDRVPLPLKSLTIEAASRLAGLPADPAERDPHLREEAADLHSRSASLARDVFSREMPLARGREFMSVATLAEPG